MIRFMKFKTSTGFKTETMVESKTLRKGAYPHLNRSRRRAAIYAQPVRRLLYKIQDLRLEMISSGIEPLPYPKSFNRKYLTGYMSQLHAQALA